jgi:sugar O-acyltransferase (sialic acid O-acetyltransferase NeuD family)
MHFMEDRKLYIFGASGHGKVVAELMATNNSKIEALFDDAHISDPFFERVFNSKEMIKPASDVALIIAIGNNKIRKNISERFSEYNFFNSIHKSAHVSPSATLGSGTVVMLQAIINAAAKIGNHVIINTAAIIEHDCIIEDFVHISPNVTLSGNTYIGKGSHLGSGAIVIPGIKIGKWCTIGAGSVIINDIPDGATVVGNPGRIINFKNNPESSVFNEEMLKNIEVIKIKTQTDHNSQKDKV